MAAQSGRNGRQVMTSNRVWRTLAAVVVFCSGFMANAYAAEPRVTPEAAKSVGNLLQLSGVQAQLNEIPEIISDGLEQRAKEQVDLKGLTYEQLQTLTKRYYNSNRLTERVVARIAAQYDPNRFDLIARILSRDPAPRLRRLKEAALAREASDALTKFAKKQAGGGDKARSAVIEELDSASAESELFTGIQALSVLAILDAVQGVEPASGATEKQANEAMLGQLYAQFLEPSQYTVRMTNLYAYREVSAEDLKAYTKLYREHVVQWFIRAAMDAVIETMNETNAQVKREIARLPRAGA